MNVKELVAIDIHTHAEEPCGTHPDDGYDDLQAAMAVYFNQPNNRPTIEETASYYRERKIGAVIFPVDAERETGYRRYPNEEVAEKAAANSDVLIPFASIDPAKGKTGRARGAAAHSRIRRSAALSFIPRCRDSIRTTGTPTCSTRRSPKPACRRFFTPGKPASVPACRAAPASG